MIQDLVELLLLAAIEQHARKHVYGKMIHLLAMPEDVACWHLLRDRGIAARRTMFGYLR